MNKQELIKELKERGHMRTYSEYIAPYDYLESPKDGFTTLPASDFKQSDSMGNFFEIPFCSWGDYVGESVTRANYEWFKKEYLRKSENKLWGVWGGYGYSNLIAHTDILDDEEIRDRIEGLFGYPLFEDETLSEIEETLRSESWDSWVCSDLESALDDAEIEYPDDREELESMFWKVISLHEIDFIFEDAVGAYIDIEKVVSLWGEIPFCPSCETEFDYFGQVCKNCPALLWAQNCVGKN